MTNAVNDAEPMPIAQPAAPSLPAALARAQRAALGRALLLIAPLLAFLAFAYVLPLAEVLRRSVDDREFSRLMPRTAAALDRWDRKAMPPPEVFVVLAAEMRQRVEAQDVALVARRLSYDYGEARALVMSTARRIGHLEGDPAEGWPAWFAAIDIRWAERPIWLAAARATGPLTDLHLLAAADLRKGDDGRLARAEPEQAIFLQVLGRTFWIGALVTLLCMLLGYPLAYLIASAPPRLAGLLTLFVLLPFWTSLLVRTTAWMVILQENGIINQLLLWSGLIEKPLRLIFNRLGVIITMVHVLLPFFVLPLLAVMRGIRPDTVRAARSLGASPMRAFLRIYLPQSYPGIAAGALLVFISAIGYYITPALVGGAEDQMLSYLIAYYTNSSANWGLASALGVLLLLSTGLLGLVYARVSGMRGRAT